MSRKLFDMTIAIRKNKICIFFERNHEIGVGDYHGGNVAIILPVKLYNVHQDFNFFKRYDIDTVQTPCA